MVDSSMGGRSTGAVSPASEPVLQGQAAGKYAVLAPEGLVPVTHLFDGNGMEVDRLDRAMRFVAGPRYDGRWFNDYVALARIVPMQ